MSLEDRFYCIIHIDNHIIIVYYLRCEYIITRLLGRPQPQMYPPVALNQYTLVNRTHKHYIYMLQGPTNILKSHQSSTICKICKNKIKFLFSSWGVLGKRTLNPEVLKCHEDLITLDTYVQQGKQWIISFTYICENINIFG